MPFRYPARNPFFVVAFLLAAALPVEAAAATIHVPADKPTIQAAIDSAANGVVVFSIDQPTDYARQLTEVILRATEELGKAVAELGRNSRALKHCIEIHSLENEADVVYRQAQAQLFSNPTDPFYVIKWKDLYSMLEKCVDKCEDVANVVESIVLKNA